MNERRWINKGRGVWDLQLGQVVLLLAKEPNGWMLWGVVVDGFNLGKRSRVPYSLAVMYDEETAALTGHDDPDLAPAA